MNDGHPLRILPEGYYLKWSKNYGRRRFNLYNRNIIGFMLGLLLVSGLDMAFQLIMAEKSISITIFLTKNFFEISIRWRIVLSLISILFIIIFHFLIHGIAFWVVLKNQPRLSFDNWVAEIAPQNWFYPKRTYILASLAPLVFPTLLGVGCMLFASWPFALWFLVCIGINGLISGELTQKVFWIIPLSSRGYIRDGGDALYFFERE